MERVDSILKVVPFPFPKLKRRLFRGCAADPASAVRFQKQHCFFAALIQFFISLFLQSVLGNAQGFLFSDVRVPAPLRNNDLGSACSFQVFDHSEAELMDRFVGWRNTRAARNGLCAIRVGVGRQTSPDDHWREVDALFERSRSESIRGKVGAVDTRSRGWRRQAGDGGSWRGGRFDRRRRRRLPARGERERDCQRYGDAGKCRSLAHRGGVYASLAYWPLTGPGGGSGARRGGRRPPNQIA